jgi:thiol:disulfide interchange protein
MLLIVGAQNHVTWEISVEDKEETATISIKASVEEGWHMYTQFPTDDCLFMPTSFTYEKSSNYSLDGITVEPETETVMVDGDKMIQFHSTPVVFTQKINKKSKTDFEVEVYVEYQTCSDMKCVQEYNTLTVKINGNASSSISIDPELIEIIDSTIQVIEESTSQTQEPVITQVYSTKKGANQYEITTTGSIAPKWNLVFTKNQGNDIFGFSNPNLKVISTEHSLDFTNDSANYQGKFTIKQLVETTDSLTDMLLNYTAYKDGETYQGEYSHSINFNESMEVSKDVDSESRSYLMTFLIAFISGFAALLTPCVFPMIPMTVSFFTKQSKTKAQGIRNALIYGLSIIGIYVALGLIVTGVFGADALNALSTNVWFNLFFFALLFIFGMSFLGAFEIGLPNSWINKADKNADRGGMIGIFFMAATLALVSFSCTGPIIGTLLVTAASEGGLSPFFGMLGFSTALALPFALFAAFPGWLNSLPQSGGWLNTVKVVLGLLEIAFSFKFLSNADLVVQAHFLEREMFLAIWIAIFSFLTLYLLGKIQLPHDSPIEKIKVPRFIFATFVFSFVIYLIPGMWGAPLKLISGFPPPITYSESPFGIGGQAPSHEEELPDGAHHGPHGLILFHDLASAEKYASEVGLPVMIDFTGLACVNCRRMEENVWSNEEVLNILKNEVVIASLHVDDKTALPENEVTTSSDGAKIRNIGNKWSYLQRSEYGSQSQPQYFILDNNGDRMGSAASYEDQGQPLLFEQWLEENLEQYNIRKDIPSFKILMAKVK